MCLAPVWCQIFKGVLIFATVSLILLAPRDPPNTSKFCTNLGVFFDFGLKSIGFPVVVALTLLSKVLSKA